MSEIRFNEEPSLEILNQNIDRAKKLYEARNVGTLNVHEFERRHPLRFGLWTKLKILLRVMNDEELCGRKYAVIEFQSERIGQKILQQLQENAQLQGVRYDHCDGNAIMIEYRTGVLSKLAKLSPYFWVRKGLVEK